MEAEGTHMKTSRESSSTMSGGPSIGRNIPERSSHCLQHVLVHLTAPSDSMSSSCFPTTISASYAASLSFKPFVMRTQSPPAAPRKAVPATCATTSLTVSLRLPWKTLRVVRRFLRSASASFASLAVVAAAFFDSLSSSEARGAYPRTTNQLLALQDQLFPMR